jgi:hypothetical protein
VSTPDNPQGTEPTTPLPPAGPAYGTPPSPPYGAAPSYDTTPYGSAPYGSAPYGSAPYGSAPYGAAPYGAYASPKTNTLAIISLVAGLVGIFVIPFIGSIVAIITGHMGLSQIKQTGEGGRGLALAGTILGYVGVGFALLLVVFFLALLPAIIGSATTYGTLS